ncbi:MAG TPA: E3 binding domain-containing protein, partial [Solirubrobacteraceae bacterium]
MSEMVMPRLSDTMEEGTILRWLKADGEHVARGEELVEIETDKATMTYESDQEGFLQIIAVEGSTLAVGEPIATVGAQQESAASGGEHAGGDAPTPDTDAPEQPKSEEQTPPAPSHDPPPASTTAETRPAGERVKASPLARRIARERGIDLSAVSGSGPGGRIVKADVLPDEQATANEGTEESASTASTPRATEAASATASEVSTAKGRTSEVELTRTQQTIARRMAESKATIPDFSIQIDVDMEECVALRTQLKRLAHPGAGEQQGSQPAAPTYNDMVVKDCALALRSWLGATTL